MPPESDPVWSFIRKSAGDVGILEPLKVCKLRVVDGRLRLHAAKVAGLDKLPVVEVAEKDVASIIVDSLIARKHLTASARIYMIFPLFGDRLAESARNRSENLSKVQNPSQVVENVDPAGIAGSGGRQCAMTAEDTRSFSSRRTVLTVPDLFFNVTL